jgi:methionyl-tRNA formyltransferase
MAGDERSGVEVMRMEAGLDTGPVCLSHAVDIPPLMTAGELHDELMIAGANLMVEALEKLDAGALNCAPQPEDGVTYAAKIDKAEARIDWQQPAQEVHNRIRGLSPFPGAWFEIELDGKRERIKVLRTAPEDGDGLPGTVLDDQLLVACGGHGAVRLTQLQRAGKRPMEAIDLLRGFTIPKGHLLA